MERDRDELRMRYGPWALVAGGSDGIGEAFAHQLAAAGIHLVLLARRRDVLEATAAEIERVHGVETRTIVADLTAPGLEATVADAIEGIDIGLLVYNAGAVHGAAKFLERPIEDARTLVDLNCHGTVTLAYLLGQPMKVRGRGGMIFMTSMSALSGGCYVATYAATKSFDLIFAEALWQELQPDGIDVLSVIAGATDTPAMRRSNDRFGEYPGIQDPNEVASAALDHLGTGPTFVPGDANRGGAAYLWPRSRVELSNMMSKATADMYDLPFTEATGEDFHPTA